MPMQMAMAAAASYAMWMPGWGMRSSRSPAGVRTVRLVASSPCTSTAVTATSSGGRARPQAGQRHAPMCER